jgi:glutamine cyclotransferase
LFDRIIDLPLPIQEGWGITNSDSEIIISDGTMRIYFLNENFEVIRDIKVHDKRGNEYKYLNELEYVNGKIISNVWLTNKIFIINPSDGLVERMIDMTLLSRFEDRFMNREKDVLNGIAYDSANHRYYSINIVSI